MFNFTVAVAAYVNAEHLLTSGRQKAALCIKSSQPFGQILGMNVMFCQKHGHEPVSQMNILPQQGSCHPYILNVYYSLLSCFFLWSVL